MGKRMTGLHARSSEKTFEGFGIAMREMIRTLVLFCGVSQTEREALLERRNTFPGESQKTNGK